LAAEPRNGDDLAQLLMEKAAGDEKILLRLINDEDIPDDGARVSPTAGRREARASPSPTERTISPT
jgi:hypothetical protein